MLSKRRGLNLRAVCFLTELLSHLYQADVRFNLNHRKSWPLCRSMRSLIEQRPCASSSLT